MGGAVVRAAPAFGAGTEIQDMLPGEVLEFFPRPRPPALRFLPLPIGQASRTLEELLEKDVRQGGNDVEVFGKGEKIQK